MAHKTAYDYRERLQQILGWSDDDLRRMPIWEGEQFDPDETYFNLNTPAVGPFSGRKPTIERPSAGDEYLFVAKSDVPDHLWLRLVDGYGSNIRMGNQAPTIGAHGTARKPPVVGRSDTDSLVHVDVPDE